MSDLIQQADAIRNLAKLYKNMGEAADTLESIGTLDQALQERKASLAVLDAQTDAVRAAAQTKLDAAREVDENTRLESNRRIGEANVEAANILAESRAQAAVMVASASSQIEADKAKAAAAIERQAEEFVARAAKTKADSEAMQAQYDMLAPLVAELTRESAKLTEAIAQARATIHDMIGN